MSFFSLFAYFRFLAEKIWALENNLLNTYGRYATGEVIKYTKRIDPSDMEYHAYVVDFVYERNGKQTRDCHRFSINTMHLGFANVGMMLDTPKLTTTIENIEETFQPGSSVSVRYLSLWPFLKRIEYEKHPHQLIDEQILAAYEKAKLSHTGRTK